jgi:hypothetical protein
MKTPVLWRLKVIHSGILSPESYIVYQPAKYGENPEEEGPDFDVMIKEEKKCA